MTECKSKDEADRERYAPSLDENSAFMSNSSISYENFDDGPIKILFGGAKAPRFFDGFSRSRSPKGHHGEGHIDGSKYMHVQQHVAILKYLGAKSCLKQM